MMDSLFHWLWLPISGSETHQIDTSVAWHGRLMVLSWSLLVPLAILMARFFKVTPQQKWPDHLDNPLWWHVHRHLNYSAAFLTVLAVLLIWRNDLYRGSWRAWHAAGGWFLITLCALQIISALLRGSKGGPTAPRLDAEGRMLDLQGDHFCMTRRRVLFERWHKGMGHLTWLVGLITTVLGLWVADAPRWMGLALLLLWLVLFCAAVKLQRDGKCMDTYQAIWGPNPHLPGHAVKPTGWGVRRYERDSVGE